MKRTKAYTCANGQGKYIKFEEDEKWVNGVSACEYDSLGFAISEMLCYGKDCSLYDVSGNLIAYVSTYTLRINKGIDIKEEFKKSKDMFDGFDITLEDAKELLEDFVIKCLE